MKRTHETAMTLSPSLIMNKSGNRLPCTLLSRVSEQRRPWFPAKTGVYFGCLLMWSCAAASASAFACLIKLCLSNWIPTAHLRYIRDSGPKQRPSSASGSRDEREREDHQQQRMKGREAAVSLCRDALIVTLCSIRLLPSPSSSSCCQGARRLVELPCSHNPEYLARCCRRRASVHSAAVYACSDGLIRKMRCGTHYRMQLRHKVQPNCAKHSMRILFRSHKL